MKKNKRRLKPIPKFILTLVLVCLAVILMFISIIGSIYINAVQMDQKYSYMLNETK